ncbi:hypothetical protein D3C71_2047280 [compost metagenome]
MALFHEYDLPKLILITLAPLSAAYRIAFATSLSRSSPLGVLRTAMITTLSATPFIPRSLVLTAAMIPET